MVGAKLATLKNGQRKTDRAGQICPAQSNDDAAALLNVSKSSIKTAKQVLDAKSKPLIAAVESGEVSVSLAAKLVNETDDKKRSPQSSRNELRHSGWCFATMLE